MRHVGLLISLILCFSSGLNFGLASDVGFGHIACAPIEGRISTPRTLPPTRCGLVSSSIPTRTRAKAAVSSRVTGLSEIKFWNVVWMAGHCLLIRIALPIEKICNGPLPQTNKGEVDRQFYAAPDKVQRSFWHPNQYKISVHTTSEFRTLVSSNHILDTKFNNLLGRIWVHPSATHDGLPLRDHLAEFTINSRTNSSNEEFFGKLLSMLCIQSHNQRPFQNERLPCQCQLWQYGCGR
jgi:hypothetical protein